MSHPLVSHSPDLTRLEQDGYDLEIRDAYLLLKHVPYVTAGHGVGFGVLVSELSTNGTATIAPKTHVAFFVGSLPCDNHGHVLDVIINNKNPPKLSEDIVPCCSFSTKPQSGAYSNYFDKMTRYVEILSGFARVLDPGASARTYPPHETTVEESVFRYLDAASSRAGIGAITARLKLADVAIIGLGGTGSYVLDLIAKTPIGKIHLYDDDVLYAHNAFRAPGAASVQDLAQTPKKVDYFFRQYDSLRRNIIPHPVKVTSNNVEELRDMNFVFIAIDSGPAKQGIVEALTSYGVSFADCGIGVYRQGDSLGGIVRVTTSEEGHRAHVGLRVSFGDEGEDEYDWNIQTPDLNMLNAVMAVLRWKKLCGFYIDRKREHHSTYTIGRNQMLSEDCAE